MESARGEDRIKACTYSAKPFIKASAAVDAAIVSDLSGQRYTMARKMRADRTIASSLEAQTEGAQDCMG
jgi:hypothetical protein